MYLYTVHRFNLLHYKPTQDLFCSSTHAEFNFFCNRVKKTTPFQTYFQNKIVQTVWKEQHDFNEMRNRNLTQNILHPFKNATYTSSYKNFHSASINFHCFSLSVLGELFQIMKLIKRTAYSPIYDPIRSLPFTLSSIAIHHSTK